MCESACTHFCVHVLTALFCSELDPLKSLSNFFHLSLILSSQIGPVTSHSSVHCLLFIQHPLFLYHILSFPLNQLGHLSPDPQRCAKKIFSLRTQREFFCDILTSCKLFFPFYCLLLCPLLTFFFCNSKSSPQFSYLRNTYIECLMCLQGL